MKTAAIYTRVSTSNQEDNYSLSTQLAACQKYAQDHKLEVVEKLADVESGAALSRPGLDKLRDLIRTKTIDAVIVYCVDRLSREAAHYYLLKDELGRHGVALHYVTKGEVQNTADGVLMDGLDVLIGQIERLRITERMRRGIRGKIEGANDGKARILGHGPVAPFGYKYIGSKQTKELVIVEHEAEIVRMIFGWYMQGMGLIRITNKLSELRIPTPSDNGRKVPQRAKAVGQWGKGTVHRILKAHVYAGILYHFRFKRAKNDARTERRDPSEWVGVPVPAIISKEVFDEVQKRLVEGRQLSPRNTKRFYLLGRRMRCSCGYAMIGTTTNRRRCYRCNGSSKDAVNSCKPTVAVYADAIEHTVWEWLTQKLEPETLRAGLEQEREQTAERRQEIMQQIDVQSRQRRALDNQLERVRAAYLAGVYDLETTAAEQAKVEAAKRSVDAELIRLDVLLTNSGPSDSEVDALMAAAAELHEEVQHVETNEGRRKIVDFLRLTVEVERVGKEYYASVSGVVSVQRLPVDNSYVAEPLGSATQLQRDKVDCVHDLDNSSQA